MSFLSPKKNNNTKAAVACFISLALVCSAESARAGAFFGDSPSGNPPAEAALSENDKQKTRDALHYLAKEDERARKARERLEERKNPDNMLQNLLQAVAEKEAKGPKNAYSLEDPAAERAHNKTKSQWRIVLHEDRSAYVITLFQEEKKLADWLKTSSEPLFNAVQFGNVELTRFFVEESGMINAARESTHFSPLQTAVISGRRAVVQFLLDHPDIDARHTNIWGENIFHTVFLAGAESGFNKEQADKKSSKLEMLRFLFQPKYFLRIFDLLITPNLYNETPLDLAKNDDAAKKREIVRLTERQAQTALRLKALSHEALEALRKKNLSSNQLDSLFFQAESESLQDPSSCGDSFQPPPDTAPLHAPQNDRLGLLNRSAK